MRLRGGGGTPRQNQGPLTPAPKYSLSPSAPATAGEGRARFGREPPPLRRTPRGGAAPSPPTGSGFRPRVPPHLTSPPWPPPGALSAAHPSAGNRCCTLPVRSAPGPASPQRRRRRRRRFPPRRAPLPWQRRPHGPREEKESPLEAVGVGCGERLLRAAGGVVLSRPGAGVGRAPLEGPVGPRRHRAKFKPHRPTPAPVSYVSGLSKGCPAGPIPARSFHVWPKSSVAEEERSRALATPGSLRLNFSLTGCKADPQSPFASSKPRAGAATHAIDSRGARKARARPSENPERS